MVDYPEWQWVGARGKRSKRGYPYKAIAKNDEVFHVGDCAIFRPVAGVRPYIGRIESLYEVSGYARLRVCWFYYAEETCGKEKTKLKHVEVMLKNTSLCDVTRVC